MARSGLQPPHRLIAVDVMSDVGNQFIALSLVDGLVFQGRQPLVNLVLLCLVHQVPSIVLSPLAGRGIGRLGARNWLMLVNAGKCLLAAGLLLVSHRAPIFLLYLGFVTASLFFSIGKLSLVPLLVSRKHLIRFNALNEKIAIAAGIVSPWLIGLILARTVPGTALTLTMLIFTGTVVMLAGLPAGNRLAASPTNCPRDGSSDDFLPLPPSYSGNCLITGRRRHRGRVGDFLAPLLDNRTVAAYFLLLGFVIFGGGILNLGLPLFFKTALNGDISCWGLILSASQGGAFLSMVLLPRWSNGLRQRGLAAAGFVVLGMALFLLPFAGGYLQVAALMAIFGFGLTLLQIFWESRIQQTTARPALGRTMSLLTSYKGVCYLGTILLGALISGLWGAESFFWVGALVLGTAGLLFTARLSPL